MDYYEDNIKDIKSMLTDNDFLNFDETSKLAQKQHYGRRFTMEMLHIMNTPTNIRIDYNTIYRHLLGK